MKPNGAQQGNSPVDVIDTEGYEVDAHGNPVQRNSQNATYTQPQAKETPQGLVGPERFKLEEELLELEERAKVIQFYRLMGKVGTELMMMDPEVKANLDEEDITLIRRILVRSGANVVISAIDFIPAGFGEATSWGADISKMTRRTYLFLKIKIAQLKRAQAVYAALEKRVGKVRGLFPEWMDLDPSEVPEYSKKAVIHTSNMLAAIRKKSSEISNELKYYLDLTPDVSSLIAVPTEALEIPTGGAFPSHAIESTIQFNADMQRLIELLKKIARIKAYLKDYRDMPAHEPSQEVQSQVKPESEEQELIREINKIFELTPKSE